MKMKLLLFAVTIASALAGCEDLGKRPGPPLPVTKQCPPQACAATITVDASGAAHIDADVLQLAHGDKGPIITWTLDAPNQYEFRDDSIQPHTGPPSSIKQTTAQTTWDSQIAMPSPAQPQRFRVKAANTISTRLSYDVKVYTKGSSNPSATIDPIIANDP